MSEATQVSMLGGVSVSELVDRTRLQKTVESLLRIAELMGVDGAWTARLRQMLNDTATMNLVVAIAEYLLGLSAAAESRGGGVRIHAQRATVEVSAADFRQWLPLVFQIIEMLRTLRS